VLLPFVFHPLGKPAYYMKKNDVDRAPSINLGYNKQQPSISKSAQEHDEQADSRKRWREEVEQERQLVLQGSDED